ncbi:hypothetical protein BBJ28_00012368 [Nothophytophthora sp. Chile5]|nr:hypothetical protein BBJ28_00012368 [Nothophytophthora sp. Chile5]
MDGVRELCPSTTTVHWEGHAYTKAYSSGRKTTFRCSYYRSSKCKARVDVMADGSYQNAVPHTCGRSTGKVNSGATAEDGLAKAVEDVVEDMKDEVDALAVANLAMVPNKIWELVREQFTSSRMIHGLTREQVVSRVYRTRNRHFGSTIYGRVEVPPLSPTKAGDATFFQFHNTYVDDRKVQHLLGWGHPALIRLLFYSQTALYIDGTFHCVPSPVYQCIIIMVHDRGSNCFVPSMYFLATNKSEWTYWHTLHCVQAATGMTMDVSTVSCDFERGLINVVCDQFSDADIVG